MTQVRTCGIRSPSRQQLRSLVEPRADHLVQSATKGAAGLSYSFGSIVRRLRCAGSQIVSSGLSLEETFAGEFTRATPRTFARRRRPPSERAVTDSAGRECLQCLN